MLVIVCVSLSNAISMPAWTRSSRTTAHMQLAGVREADLARESQEVVDVHGAGNALAPQHLQGRIFGQRWDEGR